MRIAVLKGQSQYEVLRHFSEQLAKGFQQLGCDVTIIDMLTEQWQAQLIAAAKEGLSAVVAPNGVGIGLTNAEGKSFYQALGIKFIAFFVDHPFYQLNRIQAAPDNAILTYIDQSHLAFARQYLPTHGGIHYFLPHGGSKAVTTDTTQQRRTLMFSGSYKSITLDDVLQKTYPSLFKSLLAHTYEELAGSSNSFHHAFEQVLQANGIYIANRQKLLEVMGAVFLELNSIRGCANRKKLLHACEEQGVNVDIFGPAGWQGFCEDKRYLHYQGIRNYQEILALYQQYQFVLNDNNDFKAGSHERHFDALLNGACPVSPMNTYYGSGQHSSGLGLFYETAQLSDTIAELQNADELYAAFLEGAGTLSESEQLKQTWTYRAAELFNLLALE